MILIILILLKNTFIKLTLVIFIGKCIYIL